jgi:hypothetical protein
LAEDFDSFQRVIDPIADPEAFVSLLDPEVVLFAGHPANLWHQQGYTELNGSSIKRMREAATERAREREIVRRVMTLRQGKITRIEDCPSRVDAMLLLLRSSFGPD